MPQTLEIEMPQTLEFCAGEEEAVDSSGDSSTPATPAIDTTLAESVQAKKPVNAGDYGAIGLQPKSRESDVWEEPLGNSDTTANHVGGGEEEKGQSSPTRDSPEEQADEGDDEDDEEETEEDTNEAGGVDDNGLAKLLGEELPEVLVDLPTEHTTAGTEGSLASTKCTHCGEIHGTYEKQCEVAHRLLNKIKMAIGMHDESSNPQKFKDFELYILVPSLSSLYNQNVNRLNEFVEHVRQKKNDLKDYGSFLCGMGGEGRVFKSTDGKAENDKHSEMECRIKKEKDTLLLIIRDEAHYEATRNEAKGKQPVDKFINSETVLTPPNVVTLLVSATPYSLVSKNSRIPELNITDWMDDSRQNSGIIAKQDSSGYFGLARYAENTLKYAEIRDPLIGDPKPTSGYIAADKELEKRLQKRYDAGERPEHKNGTGNKERKAKALDLDIMRCDMLTQDYFIAQAIAHNIAAVQAGQTRQSRRSTRKESCEPY